MRALLHNIFVIVVFVLFFSGCASVRVDINTLKTDGQLSGKLPLDSSAIVYIAVPFVDKEKSVSKFQATKKLLHSASLKETSVEVANKYFRDASSFSPEKKANYFVILSGDLEIDRFIGALIANLHGKVFDADGNLIFELKTFGTETTGGPLNEASLYNAIADAQVNFYDQFMLARLEDLKLNNPQNLANFSQLVPKLDKNDLRDIGTASAFVINGSGKILTNYHAVENCLDTRFDISGKEQRGTVVYVDKEADLAVLETGVAFVQYAKFVSDSKPPRLGEDIVVVGYPLQGVLSSKPSLSTGNISAMAGINDNEDVYQITAPIQSGNSGGPVLDKTGRVIGVVQSKLNAVKVAKFTGDLPQNVNFAVKSDKVVNFLKQNKVKFSSSSERTTLPTTDIADLAKTYTLKVSCTGYVNLLDSDIALSDK